MAISLPIVSSFDNKGLRNARQALQSFAGFAADVGKIAAGAVSAVAVAGIREAVAFETSIAKIEGLVGVAGDELDKLSQAARDLGPATGKSAQDAADALFVITSAGLRGADAVEALELSLKASAAGLGETEDIARSVAGALNAYGTDVLDAAQATDVIVATARAGNFETSQFAAAIGRVLPFAKQAGSSLEDMGGAVALLTRTNGDAAQSVTQVQALFRAFVVPTQEAKKALDGVGLSAEDMRVAIEEQGLPAALDMLDEKLGGNREQLGRLLGSSEAASAAFQILDADSEALAGTFGVVNDASGLTNDAFNVVADTAQFKFNESMGQVKDTLLGIGEDLLERLLPYLDQFSTFMEENGPAIEEIFDNIFEVVERVAEGVGQFISDLVGDEDFQEFLANLQQWFIDTWPQVESLVEELGELALSLTPLVTGAIEETLPFLEDLVSVMDDLTFFLNEAIAYFEDMGIDLPEWGRIIEAQINPVARLKDIVAGLAEALNQARDAYERWVASGAPPIEIDENKISGLGPMGLGGQRAMGGLVTGGSMYAVGERGPELFIPNENGTIIPNNQIGATTNYNVTVQAGVGDPVRIGEEVVTAIKRYERVSGPVFASA